jgi:hypothetical protein
MRKLPAGIYTATIPESFNLRVAPGFGAGVGVTEGVGEDSGVAVSAGVGVIAGGGVPVSVKAGSGVKVSAGVEVWAGKKVPEGVVSLFSAKTISRTVKKKCTPTAISIRIASSKIHFRADGFMAWEGARKVPTSFTSRTQDAG